ncbi:hypothetical protein K1X12_14745 [Hyphomonas sp. WL0036]|uniref:hypothetical protein n=1 Tax=Hyphomonas sediminis TaxID=2866160 RepID=UPI001C8032F9|nr:hypothetical protein [Hyphomonas sediminis]MBY9068167.1 hypothetical protein [Hyphomonas sediminis]
MTGLIKTMIAAISLFLLPGNSLAQEFALTGSPTVSYQGQRTLSAGGEVINQTVYSTRGKSRYEMVLEDTEVVQIWRDDLDVIWSISPRQNFATSIPYGSEQAGSAFSTIENYAEKAELKLVGTETINETFARRYKMNHVDGDGGATAGDVWVSPENITIRMRITHTLPGKHPDPIHYDLTNLILTDQPDYLFELPPGIQVFPMGTVAPGLAGMAGGYAGDVATDAKDAALGEADRTVRAKARSEARKAVGKIFDW